MYVRDVIEWWVIGVCVGPSSKAGGGHWSAVINAAAVNQSLVIL